VKREEYVHQELNQEVTAIGGRYLLAKEVRLPVRGRELLYLVGHAAFDTACCGAGGCAYALVPGFVVDWQARLNSTGLAVSQVEPVRGQEIQRQIRRLIERQEPVHQVIFL
jgi:hypothetical protein